jgi:hypothetical protein
VTVRAASARDISLMRTSGASAHPTLYGVTFAYGSNSNAAQMTARCPRAEKLGLVRIAGYRLEFYGALDLEPDPAGTVHAVAWRLDPHDERALDHHEGANRHPVPSYLKVPLAATLPDGAELHGFAYVMTPPRRARDPRPPKPDYLARILAGYEHHGVLADELHAALARASAPGAP